MQKYTCWQSSDLLEQISGRQDLILAQWIEFPRRNHLMHALLVFLVPLRLLVTETRPLWC